MKRLAFILQWALISVSLLCLGSCRERNVIEKKEMWASVIDFLSPDSSYYSPMKNFPFPESLRFEIPDTLFVNHNRPPIINDSNIIYYKRHDVNGENVCCKTDTLEIYSDTIRGKKYLFLIGEYIALFQSDSAKSSLRPRKITPSIPLWGIKLNTPYPADKFLNKYEKLGMDFVKLREDLDEVTRQTWADNDSILVETIQFDDASDRIVTSVYKDMNEDEVNLFINYIKLNFPSAKLKEAIQKDAEGKPMKIMRILIDGYSITITQTSEKEYSFQASDYYETIKLILGKQQHYTFRDDIKIY